MIQFAKLKFVRFDKISELQVGDQIRHIDGAESLVVTAIYGDFAIGVRTTHISNPNEWELIKKEV